MSLDTTSPGNAVRRLREGLARYEREPADEQLRDGLIQRFEFTYELSHKMLRRYLKDLAASPDEIERVPFPDLDPDRECSGLAAGRLAGLAAVSRDACPYKHTLMMPKWHHRSPPRSQGFWKKPSISTPNCNGGSHDPSPCTSPYRQTTGHLVLGILRANSPRGTQIWGFGSRATGRARRYSDLDLAIDAGRRLSLDELAQLTEAFSDSDLPYKVDIIDWHNIDARWRQTILTERVVLTEGTSS